MEHQSWNVLVQAYAPAFGAFLQSWEWGEFQRSFGREVVRIQEERDGKVMIAQAIRLPLPLGQSYWLVPKGPLGDMEPQTMQRILRERLKGAAFIRTEGNSRLPGGVKTKDMHPSTTLVLDMRKGCDGLLMEMHMKTRYNIRLGERKGVTIRRAGLEDFQSFVDIVAETTERNEFSAHPAEYYRKMLEMLQGDCHAFLVFAEAEGQMLATNIMIDFLDTRTYLHGASRGVLRNLKAADVLQFSLINEA
ncbi:MAG: peptidoglycan bridge formation glycyltransferase FemA/FemB family protein, partial [Candidatus Uhrbacteria bacterium]|nr:peptidoglycan bridge formation glycyltransferase FemA/FemB family protein [Candidatus Uhrbacteria bacterium]